MDGIENLCRPAEIDAMRASKCYDIILHISIRDQTRKACQCKHGKFVRRRLIAYAADARDADHDVTRREFEPFLFNCVGRTDGLCDHRDSCQVLPRIVSSDRAQP